MKILTCLGCFTHDRVGPGDVMTRLAGENMQDERGGRRQQIKTQFIHYHGGKTCKIIETHRPISKLPASHATLKPDHISYECFLGS